MGCGAEPRKRRIFQPFAVVKELDLAVIHFQPNDERATFGVRARHEPARQQ